MKINGIRLDELLLKMTFVQFQSIPCEAEIDHTFSPQFEEGIRRTAKKSKSAAWRIWQAPVKRAIIIAVFVIAMLFSVAWAIPAIRHARIVSSKPHIPQVVETYYIPTFEPEGFTLRYRDRYDSEVVYLWENKNQSINYRQRLVRNTGNASKAETEARTTKTINGFSVEILSRDPGHPFTAEWTDGRYHYSVSISASVAEPYPIFEALMHSLVAVGAPD